MPYSLRSERVLGYPAKQFAAGGLLHYHVRVYVEATGRDSLDTVEVVSYTLHPTFRRPQVASTLRERNFEVLIWAWGTFTATAKLVKRDGAVKEISGVVTWDIDPHESENIPTKKSSKSASPKASRSGARNSGGAGGPQRRSGSSTSSSAAASPSRFSEAGEDDGDY